MLAVAGLSARMLAEAAVRDGFEAIALDVFGDVDTCAVAARWWPIGLPGEFSIHPEMLLGTLERLAQRGDLQGWVAGSGFEAAPGLLERGAGLLPLIGNSAQAIDAVRDPKRFFAALAALGIPFPPLADSMPPQPRGWLLKSATSSGGSAVQALELLPAAARERALRAPGSYLQQQAPGLPLSATFIADGHAARLIGCNRQLTSAAGSRPYRFSGLLGPLALPAPVQQRIGDWCSRLAGEFGLRGLASLDLMQHGDELAVLEINPRVPASIALYPRLPLLRWHVAACTDGTLPPPQALRPGAGAAGIEGFEIVFARRTLEVDAACARWLATHAPADARLHDLPCAGQRIRAGEPLCTLGACGLAPDELQRRLHDERERLLDTLESLQ